MRPHDWIKQITVLLTAAVVLAFSVNVISPRGIPWLGQWDESQGVVAADQAALAATLDLEIPDAQTARRLHAAGQVLFVDSRTADDYREGHIPKAVSLPIGEFDRRIEAFLTRYGRDIPMITYCSGRRCQDSHMLAQLLFEQGYENVSVFIDGYPGWAAEGFPVETQ
ncbi:MAG: rhodanese-like domain-containing protein [Desulfosarcina sp.]|nr:rhodanese-like domain-containing protein [Desulfobacterales bacterium]